MRTLKGPSTSCGSKGDWLMLRKAPSYFVVLVLLGLITLALSSSSFNGTVLELKLKGVDDVPFKEPLEEVEKENVSKLTPAMESVAPPHDKLDLTTVLPQYNGSHETSEGEEVATSRGNDTYDQVSRSGKGHNRQFGRRPFGPLARYSPPQDSDLKWIGYFLEESLALILKTSENVMLDCTVIELRTEREQREAQKTLGVLMELTPLELPEMVQLMQLCGQLPKNQVFDYQEELNQGQENTQQFSFIIFPGTKWCGMQDVADRFENLGPKHNLDECCRVHDHCPYKVGSFETRYGISNFGFATRSHCLCDQEFFECLKKVATDDAKTIGNVYFNLLRVKCLQSPDEEITRAVPHKDPRAGRSLYECRTMDEKGACRLWRKEKIEYAFKFVDFTNNF